ncbi:MAG TPA: hypothetical protein VHS09_15620 [Polyangiaceae bacterium]|nr:hypothetical protein [Polyangiaceae bacterium]
MRTIAELLAELHATGLEGVAVDSGSTGRQGGGAYGPTGEVLQAKPCVARHVHDGVEREMAITEAEADALVLAGGVEQRPGRRSPT